jgi:hypothetical protein
MQHASCNVALNGDITFIVHKPDVTVAEIAILRAIHGADAVRNIEPTYTDKRPHAQERERLVLEYGKAKDHKDETLIDKVFPSFSPLPTSFKDIGLDIDGTDSSENEPEISADKEEKPRRGRKPKVEEEEILSE